MSLFSLFRIRRDERLLAAVALTVLLLLNALIVWKYYGLLTPLGHRSWNVLVKGFHLSGFDSITYYVISDWHARYNVYRHPLLSFVMYVPYLLNLLLMRLTGINCALFLVAAMLVTSSLYSVIFFRRILLEVIGVRLAEGNLLTAFFFSFAYIMLATMVPDHFAYSLCALLLTLYLSGRMMKEHRPMEIRHTVLLFLLAAGISLNNGLKVFLSALFTGGRRFWHPRFLILAVILPSLALWGFARFEYSHFVWADEKARHEAQAHRKAARQKRQMAQLKAQSATSDTGKMQQRNIGKAMKPKKKRTQNSVSGKPIAHGEFMNWTDISTSRGATLVENLFGESIQLHEDYVLGDIFRGRPVLVSYSTPMKWVNYSVEALLVLLFAAGAFIAIRQRFFLMVGSWFLLDMSLHIGLGFGINEVYIMTAHWAFIIPIAIAYLLLSLAPPTHRKLCFALLVLTLFLWGYNGSLLLSYLFA
ncbi:MAG: GtrA family protein [Prevotella sp.]|nr:GtrA family protein [Prevotella sp.]